MAFWVRNVSGLGITIPQTTIIRWRCFTVGRLTETPVKYIFSTSIRVVDYTGIFIKIKKLMFSEYSALLPKVQRFTSQVRFQSDLIGRTRSTSLCLFDTPVLRIRKS